MGDFVVLSDKYVEQFQTKNAAIHGWSWRRVDMVGLPLLIYCRGSVGGGGVAHLTQNSVALQKVVFSTVGMGLN